MWDIEFCGAFKNIDQGIDVIFKIHQWFFYRFAYCFICGKMNDAINVWIFLEYGMGIIKYAKVDCIIFHFYSRDLFHPFKMAGLLRLLLSAEITSYPFCIRSTIVCDPI